MTTAQYVYWEIQEYLLATEEPGKFGYFGEDSK